MSTSNKQKRYLIVDLCAGIGGIRLGFEQTNRVSNVYSVEIDKYACKTYLENFGEDPYGDITLLDKSKILKLPDFDILCAGFPCQSFSIAGYKNGFSDTRGTLFFNIAQIIKLKKPKAILLENVKGLTFHDKGETLSTMLKILKEELNYDVSWRILNSKDFGVPQNRERVYIVGFDRPSDFKFPNGTKRKKLQEIIDKKPVSSKYYISDTYLNTLMKHKQRHESRGNGFGFKILDPEGISNAIVVGGMGKERNLIIDKRLTDMTPITNLKGEINKDYVRRLSPREWARLQGFPEKFKIPVSDTQAYKQFGNSVSVPVIKSIARKIIKTLDQYY
jgi:DNA (cytosine-5)-methyltransferase 1